MQHLPGKYYMSADLVIRASAQKVWDVLADFSAVDTWAPQVTKSFALGPEAQGLGAGRHCDIKGFGSIQEEIIEWNEGRGFTYRVTPLGPLGVSQSRWTVYPIDSGSCKVVTELGYDVRMGLFGKLLHALMMRPKLKKAFPQSLEALGKRVETGELVRPRRAQPGLPQLAAAAA